MLKSWPMNAKKLAGEANLFGLDQEEAQDAERMRLRRLLPLTCGGMKA
jgi:hypothetical protein